MVALMATVVIHATVVAGVIWGGWLETASFQGLSKPETRLVTVRIPTPPPPQSKPPKPKPPRKPNIFVPVPKELATPNPPKKETPLYSNKNAQAAQPVSTPQPKLNGEQATAPSPISPTKPISLQSNPQPATQPITGQPALQSFGMEAKANEGTRSKPIPIAPSAPVAALPLPAPAEHFEGLKKIEFSGNATRKAADRPISSAADLLPTFPGSPQAPTLQQAKSGLGSRNMDQQNAGTARLGAPSLDVRLTGYGDYDARFFAAISIAWRKQIKNRSWVASTVKVDFNLHADGRIDEVQIHDTTAASILQFFCREAIEQPAPFESWSNEMRAQLGPGPRRCRITFNYLVR